MHARLTAAVPLLLIKRRFSCRLRQWRTSAEGYHSLERTGASAFGFPLPYPRVPARRLKQMAKREGAAVDTTKETEILIKAVRVNTLSKLTYGDTRLFLALIGDVFPGVESGDIPGVILHRETLASTLWSVLSFFFLVLQEVPTKRLPSSCLRPTLFANTPIVVEQNHGADDGHFVRRTLQGRIDCPLLSFGCNRKQRILL